MNQTMAAIYENGLLRPVSPLDLPEQSEVEITIHIDDDSLRSKVRQTLEDGKNSNDFSTSISNERRAELAKIFSADKSLSEYVGEDRED